MTFRTTISSKGDPKEFLKRGFKSMFGSHETTKTITPPADTKQKTSRSTYTSRTLGFDFFVADLRHKTL